MQLYAGTSGFSYGAWRGAFYPPRLPAGEMLRYYASRLPAVEINNTFYRLPSRSTVDAWRERVPAGFRFAIKASRRITHLKRLADCDDELTRLLDSVDVLGPQLGAVLFQLPPGFSVDADRLVRFLQRLPADTPAAFEFRHPSWRDDAVFAALQRFGAAWVGVDVDGTGPQDLPATASWTYLRLRADTYPVPVLAEWRRACAGFERAFVFFKHEDRAAGPAFAETMLSMHDA